MGNQKSRLYHSGIATFMRSPYLNDVSLVPKGAVAVAGVPFDYTCGSRPGTRYGPRAIRQSSLYMDYFLGSSKDTSYVDISTGEIFQIPGSLNIVDLGDVDCFPTDLNATMQAISGLVKTICLQEAFPLLLGGDHFITIPAFAGFAEGRKEIDRDVRIGYIHLDSHLDVFDENPSWGKLYHGSTVRRILESDMLDPSAVMLIKMHGAVGLESWEFIRSKKARLVPLSDLRKQGISRRMTSALTEMMREVDVIYLSVDIDSVAGAFAPGTGGITLDGLTPTELFEALSVLADFPVAALDLVEVAPEFDPAERTQRLAAEALFLFFQKKGLIAR